MWESLLHTDTEWLVAINSWHNSFFDCFFWNISQKWTWIPLYIVMTACLIRKYGKRSIWLLLIAVACVGLADYISSGIIKHWVCRPRPTHEVSLDGILHIVNGYRGGQYGFVSSHAADTFSLTLIFSLIWRDWRTTLSLMLWVALNCWSRMYLGVHYPGDIIGGLLTGALIAGIAYALLATGYKLRNKTPIYKKSDLLMSSLWNNAVGIMFAITCLAAMIPVYFG